jgi:multidrug efflux pump subunit AcrA (membrane-fusion protein)
LIKKTNSKSNKNRITRIIAFAMAGMLCISGCGKVTQKAPELLEPVSTNASYRPVTIGDVGNKVIKNGSVVPTDYCYFYTTTATISKIYVNVGDYVKEGDTLVEADSDENETSIDELKAELSNLEQSHSINQNIYEEKQKEYDYKIKACEEFGDSSGADAARNDKAVEAENNRYDTLLYEHQVKKINAQIEEKEELSTNNTIVADHSGYVTYVKDISDDDTEVGSSDNVVIVSDYDEPYIEITGESVSKDGYSVFNIMYTVIDGKKYDLEEYTYSNQELAAAQSASKLPYVRFKLKDADSSVLKTGSTIPLYFSTSSASNVMVIGNDSLYTEGEQSFVYVKTDSNEKERRDIVIGVSDNNYTEVVSGLSEGDLVYYDSDSALPSTYTTYDVTLSDFKQSGSSSKYSLDDTNQIVYSAPVDGYFVEFDLTKGQEVKKGDLLFTIDSGGGSAELLDINSQITDAKETYDDEVEEYDDQIKDLNEQIQMYKSMPATTEETTTEEVTTEKSTNKKTEEATTEKSTNKKTEEATTEKSTNKKTEEATTEKSTNKKTEEATTEKSTNKKTEEATTEKSTNKKTTEEVTTEVTTEATEESAELQAVSLKALDDDLDDDYDEDDYEDYDYDEDDNEQSQENTLYMVEQLTCEINIAKYNQQLAKVTYDTTVSPLIAQRDKLNENNDGKGNISVYAESDGTIQKVYVSTGYSLTEGDKIVSIGSEENKILSSTLESESSSKNGNSSSSSDDSSSGTLLVNQSVTLTSTSDDSKKLTGKCIGNSGDSQKSYITTIDDKVYITSCSGSDTMKYYIQVDDEDFYSSPKGYKISYAKLSLEQIVTIPKNMLYHESDKTSGKEYDYVWKVVDDEIVKQYVTKGEENNSSYCILSGLNEGDVLAKETAE